MKSEDDPEARIRELEQPLAGDGPHIRGRRKVSRRANGPPRPVPGSTATAALQRQPSRGSTAAANAALQRLAVRAAADILPQPDVVDRGRCLRDWHDRPAGRDLALYRTPVFAQRLTTLFPTPSISSPEPSGAIAPKHPPPSRLRRRQARTSSSPASTRAGRSPATRTPSASAECPTRS